VAALVIPIQSAKQDANYKLYHALKLMDGALTYLQHKQKGYDLPLVAYDINQPENEMFYTLARTPEQAIQLAENAAQEVRGIIGKETNRYEKFASRLAMLSDTLQSLSETGPRSHTNRLEKAPFQR
jgi:hypothetical protein